MVAEENVPKDPKVDKDTLDAEEAEVAVDQTTSHETPKSERPSAINTGHLTNPSETEPDGKEYEGTNTLSTEIDKDHSVAEEAEVAVDHTTSNETPKSERPSAINTGHLTNPSETEPDGKEYEATNTLSTESDKDHSVGINLIMSSPKNCLLNA